MSLRASRLIKTMCPPTSIPDGSILPTWPSYITAKLEDLKMLRSQGVKLPPYTGHPNGFSFGVTPHPDSLGEMQQYVTLQKHRPIPLPGEMFRYHIQKPDDTWEWVKYDWNTIYNGSIPIFNSEKPGHLESMVSCNGTSAIADCDLLSMRDCNYQPTSNPADYLKIKRLRFYAADFNVIVFLSGNGDFGSSDIRITIVVYYGFGMSYDLYDLNCAIKQCSRYLYDYHLYDTWHVNHTTQIKKDGHTTVNNLHGAYYTAFTHSMLVPASTLNAATGEFAAPLLFDASGYPLDEYSGPEIRKITLGVQVPAWRCKPQTITPEYADTSYLGNGIGCTSDGTQPLPPDAVPDDGDGGGGGGDDGGGDTPPRVHEIWLYAKPCPNQPHATKLIVQALAFTKTGTAPRIPKHYQPPKVFKGSDGICYSVLSYGRRQLADVPSVGMGSSYETCEDCLPRCMPCGNCEFAVDKDGTPITKLSVKHKSWTEFKDASGCTIVAAQSAEQTVGTIDAVALARWQGEVDRFVLENDIPCGDDPDFSSGTSNKASVTAEYLCDQNKWKYGDTIYESGVNGVEKSDCTGFKMKYASTWIDGGGYESRTVELLELTVINNGGCGTQPAPSSMKATVAPLAVEPQVLDVAGEKAARKAICEACPNYQGLRPDGWAAKCKLVDSACGCVAFSTRCPAKKW